MPAEMPADEPGRTWWRDGVLYQIYPRSYMDTNGDGIGDLRGITARLDHLQWLGVDGIWLDPIMVSPNKDWGYDVADYCAVDPALGTLADADELVARGGDARHPGDARSRARTTRATSTRGSRTRSRRATRSTATGTCGPIPKPDGSPPNNWVMAFDPRVPAWTFDEASGQYYLNQFLSSQPDLNWWNDDVRDAFDDILRFWFDRGVAGFRIDVCHSIIKDRDLRDNPLATKDDHWWVQMSGQRSVYNASRPEVHDVLRRWRTLADGYDPHRVLIGETYVLDPTAARLVLRRRRRAEPRVQLHAAALEARGARAARRDRGGGAVPPGERVAGVDGRQPRQPPLPVAVVRRRPREDARRDGDADGPARHAVPLLRRRDRHARHRDPRRPRARSGRRVPRRAHGSRSRNARRCRGPANRARATPSRASSRGSPTATSPRATSPTSVTIPTRCSRSRATSSVCATRCPSSAAAPYATLPSSDDRLWAWLRGERTVVAMNCSDDAGRRSRRGHRHDPHLDASARATANASPAHCTSSRGKPRSSGATPSDDIRPAASTASRPRGPLRPASERSRQQDRSGCRPWSRAPSLRRRVAHHQRVIGTDRERVEREREHLGVGLLDAVLEREHVAVDVLVEVVPAEVITDVVVDVAHDRDTATAGAHRAPSPAPRPRTRYVASGWPSRAQIATASSSSMPGRAEPAEVRVAVDFERRVAPAERRRDLRVASPPPSSRCRIVADLVVGEVAADARRGTCGSTPCRLRR